MHEHEHTDSISALAKRRSMITFDVGLQQEARMRPNQNPEPHTEGRSRLSVGLVSAAGVIAATSWLATSSPTDLVPTTIYASYNGSLAQTIDSEASPDRPELGSTPTFHTPVQDTLALASDRLQLDPELDRRLLDAPKQGPPARR
jgi:hypothetical protein